MREKCRSALDFYRNREYNIVMAKEKYMNVKEIAEEWGVSERAVRYYIDDKRIPGAVLREGEWLIPAGTGKPESRVLQKQGDSLLKVLRRENRYGMKGGIYHKIQVDLTYNSNHIEGSRLSHDQTRYIFETNTVGMERRFQGINTDDIVETTNHFRCIDYIIDNANRKLTESMIKKLHFILKNGTSDSRRDWFSVGGYKKLPNEVGGVATTAPEDVSKEMKKLLKYYRSRKVLELEDLLDFHYRFESIHPFQDGNGRVGRLILFKECLRLGIVPFIIDEEHKMFYYRGLKEWRNERGCLMDTCLSAQDEMKKALDYFQIEY